MKKIILILSILMAINFTACKRAGDDNFGRIKGEASEPDNKAIAFNNAAGLKGFEDIMEASNILKGDINSEILQGANLIYSPYSANSVYSLLSRYSKAMENEEVFPGFPIKDLQTYKLRPTLIDSRSLFLVNSEPDTGIKALDGDGILKVVGFPDKAKKLAMDLQKEVLGEVLLEPNYNGMDLSIINATRFFGGWDHEFDKDLTAEDKFNTFDGEARVPFMNQELMGKIAYQTEYFTAVYKEAKVDEKKARVYFMVPKEMDEMTSEDLYKKALEDMVDAITNDKYFDRYDVILKTPKIDLTSNIDLLKTMEASGRDFVNKNFAVDQNVQNPSDESYRTRSIKQVAKLKIDEKKVEAKAVTILAGDKSEAPIEEVKTLEVICDKPYFVIITSPSVDGELITFMALITNPQ
ncbi:serpin family protein [uncultured Ezakiella sp.]|uniref:serpin family protein n=1 Tax=uncultured Ezakiella sp. TaxID=1637529 RepID=UPI0025F2A1CB|nr:serpin family protein [uncultured Ezakiella sp.]